MSTRAGTIRHLFISRLPEINQQLFIILFQAQMPTKKWSFQLLRFEDLQLLYILCNSWKWTRLSFELLVGMHLWLKNVYETCFSLFSHIHEIKNKKLLAAQSVIKIISGCSPTVNPFPIIQMVLNYPKDRQRFFYWRGEGHDGEADRQQSLCMCWNHWTTKTLWGRYSQGHGTISCKKSHFVIIFSNSFHN